MLQCGEHFGDGIDVGRVRQLIIIRGGRDLIAEARVRASESGKQLGTDWCPN
ncbi:hypothetical protein [Mesorhizobium huakuii]|uniref:Uncharacterized protein n=1 Tax=Mesorhizobium huakuii TaxID=28104 RepID=A0A7G6SL47_9HYPH|nr:hypothetical protein [Mesorhizobium huakuii]QND55229.1 hypothetical protein HB778_05495 [Mesorhizobium huakuii]